MAIGKIVDYEAEFSFELISPETERPFGWSWRVVSGSSEQAKSAQKRVAAKGLANQQGQRKSKKKTVAQFEAQITDNMESMLDLISPCVVGWDITDDLKKKHPTDDFEFSDKSLAVFLDVPWIFEQVNEAVNDIANFTQK